MKHKELIDELTLKEKCSLLSGKTVWETQNIDKHNIPSIFLSDGPTGLRKQLGASDQLGLNESQKSTCFPTANTVANSFDVELAHRIGEELAKQAKALDVNLLLGPGMNIKRNPLCGRCFEYFSEDPYLAGKIAAGYVKGIQENGVGSCIKHFACNNQELRRMQNDSIVDERALREIYLTGFEIAVKDASPYAIMSAYNSLNGEFANENHHLLVDILREDWSYDGMVVTDWGGNVDRVKSMTCYSSLEMPTTCGETDREVEQAVIDGKLDVAYVDQSVDYLLTLIDRTYIKDKEKTQIDFVSGADVAYNASLDSIVLLRNQDNILPLAKGTKIAVIGDMAETPRFQGAGSSKVNPEKVDSHVVVLSNDKELTYVGYAQGYERFGGESKKLLKEAVEVSEKADVSIVFIGLDEHTEVEGLDREHYSLRKEQIDLLKKLKESGRKVVSILCCGAAVDLRDVVECSEAIVFLGLSGERGADALADIITGRACPSGHLSESFPYKYEDHATSSYFPGKERTSEYRESIFVGYRYYTTAGVDVLYPFGYGLSYASFEYSDLVVDSKGVSFKITNTSDVDAKEVPQLYIGLNDSKIFRSRMELKGFAKVLVKAHETVEVRFDFDEYTFRYFNVATNKFEIEKGTYTVYVGASSTDIRLEGNVDVDGTTEVLPYQDVDVSCYMKADVKNVTDDQFKAVLGHDIPSSSFNRNKKGRIIVDMNTTMRDLCQAQGSFGRFFGRVIRFAIKFLKAIGQRGTADMLVQGVYNQTVKTVSRMTNGFMSWGQCEALMVMFNGHFFKGLKLYFKEGKKKKKLKKELKQTGQKC